MVERTFKKIPYLENPVDSHRRAGTIRLRRSETDQQIMQESLLRTGIIRLNIPFRIKHVRTGNYAGWHDSALTVDVPSITTAREFRNKLHEAIITISQELGLSVLPPA